MQRSMQLQRGGGVVMTDKEMVTIEIDGNSVSVAKETTIPEAAQSINVYIPALCNNELVEP